MAELRVLTFFLTTTLAAAGCQEKVNPVASNVSFGPDDRFATRILDSSGRAEVLSIMRQSVNRPVDDPARKAEYGVRWSDVVLAADKAGNTLELAVLSTTVEEQGAVKRIRLISVGEVPVELVVRKVPPPQVYEASAVAGLFEDRTTLAANLLREFHSAMRAFGAKPGWPPLRNE